MAEQQRREHIGQLMALREVAGQANAEDANAAAAAHRAAARARDIDAARQALADQQARLEDLTGQRDAAQRAATRLPAVQADAERQRAAASDAAQLAEAGAGQCDLHSERETAREIANDLAERALLIRRDRIDGMVAELAASLVDGTPCPVCGSQDHPDKPEIQTRRVTHEEEEQAVAEADNARRSWPSSTASWRVSRPWRATSPEARRSRGHGIRCSARPTFSRTGAQRARWLGSGRGHDRPAAQPGRRPRRRGGRARSGGRCARRRSRAAQLLRR